MKSFKNLIFVFASCLFVATSLTSCLDSDDDNTTITKEEAARRLNLMQGTYYGKAHVFYLEEENYTVKSDSLDTSFSINTDSVLTAYLPMSMLKYGVRDKSNENLIEALKTAGMKQVKFKLFLNDIYRDTDTSAYAYYLMPMQYINFQCSYGDQTYDIVVKFTTSAYYFDELQVTSYGIYSRGQAMAYLPVGSVVVNNSEYIISPMPFLVVGK